jgi:hypothetical protein
MARKARKGTAADTGTMADVSESKIEAFAEDLGRLLGTARNRAEGWLSQRDVIIKDLTRLRDAANEYLSKLTASEAARRGARYQPAPRSKMQRRRKRQLSPEARERIAAAQRKRWAKFRATKKG